MRVVCPLLATSALVFCFCASQTTGFPGPDLVTCQIGGNSPNGGFMNYGESGARRAYAVMTFACNEGDQGVNWDDELPEPDNAHPVIATNMFRLRNGRIDQIGQAWLKHGGAAAQNDWCTTCQPGGNSELLGIGCCDVYGEALNGDQFGLGPKSEVNPATGFFPFPFCSPADGGMNCPPANSEVTTRRLQIKTTAIDLTPGVQYFIEVTYLSSDDALLAVPRTDFNNASYRPVSLNAQGDLEAWQGPTVKYEPAIRAWKLNGLGPGIIDPDVHEMNIDVPNDGRIWLAAKATDLGSGFWQYEYIIQNYNSDRAVQALSVPLAQGATVTSVGFHDVDYHSGEPYSLDDWPHLITPTSITWHTQTHDQNVNANALRWGTMYNYRFNSNIPPGQGDVSLNLFKPGTPSSVSATTVVPMLALPAVAPSQTQAGVKARYYALQNPTVVPDFDSLGAIAAQTVAQLNFAPTLGEFAGSGLTDNVGGLFSGYVSIPQDGLYFFYTTSDDGSKLFIDDMLVVNNDGLHGMVEKSGAVHLQAGLHKLRVEFFDATEAAGLIVSYQGAGLPKQIIPAGALFRNLPADVNDTGAVDVDDLLAVINNWGTCKVPPAACEGDISADGEVDVDDLLAVINSWG